MGLRIVHPPPPPPRGGERHLGGGQLARALALAALSAGFWGTASGSAGAGWMTLATLVLHAAASRRHGERFLARAALSFLVGGTWAAVELIRALHAPR